MVPRQWRLMAAKGKLRLRAIHDNYGLQKCRKRSSKQPLFLAYKSTGLVTRKRAKKRTRASSSRLIGRLPNRGKFPFFSSRSCSYDNFRWITRDFTAFVTLSRLRFNLNVQSIVPSIIIATEIREEDISSLK